MKLIIAVALAAVCTVFLAAAVAADETAAKAALDAAVEKYEVALDAILAAYQGGN